MYIKNATMGEVERALRQINGKGDVDDGKFSGNVCWNREPEWKGKQIALTLRVKESNGPGHRLGFCRTSRGNRKRLTSACWHVHGYFFEALLEINPNIVIKSLNKTIDINGGNWQNWNIGSIMDPLYHSEACECSGEVERL
jgi:hypothetical protein